MYNDGRFYKVGQDYLEINLIPDERLTAKEMALKKIFQKELNTAPPHYFKQPGEYRQ